MLSTEILTDPSCFHSLKEDWLDLLDRSVTNYVFQTPQFLAAWWHSMDAGKLQIVVVRDKERLVGIAPLFTSAEEGKQVLHFVGCVNVSDYLDVIVDRNQQTEVYEAFSDAMKELRWDYLYWCSLPESSPTRDWLKQTFPNAQETEQDVCPQIQLPATWDEYLSGIDRKQRHEIRRKMRRVDEVEHTYELITAANDARAALPDFIRLHKASSTEKKEFWDETHLSFFEQAIPAMADGGWLKLYFLKIGDVRAAAMMVFDYNNQYLLYNSGFDPNHFRNLSTGNVLTAYTIQRAIEERKIVYDFLRGNEEYKFRFGAESVPVFDIRVER